MVDEKKLELIKKLQALAERGVSGEKETAQRKVEQLMEKYNIEETDLSEEKTEDHEFKYHNEHERMLLRQLLYKIVPECIKNMYSYKWGKGSRTILGITCTKAQALQIQIEYDFYCSLWKEELDFFFKAFIQKHRIFPIKSDKDSENDAKCNFIPDEEYMRMMTLMDGMQNKSIQQMIGQED